MDSSSDYELFNPPERDEDPQIYRVLGRDFVVRMPDSDADWQMGPIQKEKYRTYGESISIEDLTVLCIATQVWGPSVGRKAVMKLKIQTSKWSKDVSHVGDSPITREIEQEIDNLERLTEGKCSCTPHLIDSYIFRQTEDEFIPGGYISVVLMEKVPGYNLMNFHEFPLEKRNQVRIAFAKAMREFGQLGIYYWDPARRNLIWDDKTERCFIVDFEDAEYYGPPYEFDPYLDFTAWSLNSQYIRGDHFEDDPMVPTLEESHNYVDNDESLMALVARTENASRANILKKRQMYQATRDGPKVVMTRVEDSEMYKVLGTDYIVTMPWSDTEWKMGPIQQERHRTYEYSKHGSVEELCALCVATQVWGPSVGRKAVMKLKIQASPWSIGAPEGTYPHAIGQEFENQERLTEGKCSCNPKLIDFYIFSQAEEDFVPGGYFAVTLMEKVPGRNLRNFGDFPLEKRNRVRMAFAKAMREFLSFGIQHLETGRRNVLWDDETERCFTIDLEDAEYGGSPIKFHPFSEFCQWRLNSPHERGDNLEDDPMIPSAEEYYDYVDSDEALMALAARTENASRAEFLKRQACLDMEDESKIVKIRTGRRDPSRVKRVNV